MNQNNANQSHWDGKERRADTNNKFRTGIIFSPHRESATPAPFRKESPPAKDRKKQGDAPESDAREN